LRAQLAAIPPGEPVRLGKHTSNLFRPRAGTNARRLPVDRLTGVLSVDPASRTADVQGMCTYESLVAATLPYGLMPKVVPQLKSITLGGAVTGLGIESSSFRNGLPHESVIEMDVLTGAAEVLTVSATEHPEFFRGFPNSYGSLGYAVRLKIELDPVRPYVGLRHVRFADVVALSTAVTEICHERAWQGEAVDFLDGVWFGPGDLWLTLGRWVDRPDEAGQARASDYTGQKIYYRSIRERTRDCLTVHDYLWRWDTDWFWCSSAFGVQHPVIRRLWPARYRRSDVYHRLVALDHRFGFGERIDRRKGISGRERVVQDVEVPGDRLGEFLDWFDDNVGMSPVWLCPMMVRTGSAGDRPWPLYPMSSGEVYVNVGFWGSVVVPADSPDGRVNRAIEDEVAALGGHKSLYSDAYYDRSTFDATYGGSTWQDLKQQYDPANRLPSLYDKVVGRR